MDDYFGRVHGRYSNNAENQDKNSRNSILGTTSDSSDSGMGSGYIASSKNIEMVHNSIDNNF